MSCEHELNLVDENWMSEQTLYATLECQKCKEQFKGLLIKQDIPHEEAGKILQETVESSCLPIKKVKGGENGRQINQNN